MIGDQTTGTIDGLHITAVSHQPPQATYQGRPVRLAIIDDNGPDGTGGTFPRPGGDWDGRLLVPLEKLHHEYRNQVSRS